MHLQDESDGGSSRTFGKPKGCRFAGQQLDGGCEAVCRMSCVVFLFVVVGTTSPAE